MNRNWKNCPYPLSEFCKLCRLYVGLSMSYHWCAQKLDNDIKLCCLLVFKHWNEVFIILLGSCTNDVVSVCSITNGHSSFFSLLGIFLKLFFYKNFRALCSLHFSSCFGPVSVSNSHKGWPLSFPYEMLVNTHRHLLNTVLVFPYS